MVIETVMFGNTSLSVNCRLVCRSLGRSCAFFQKRYDCLISERSDDGIGISTSQNKSSVANPCTSLSFMIDAGTSMNT